MAGRPANTGPRRPGWQLTWQLSEGLRILGCAGGPGGRFRESRDLPLPPSAAPCAAGDVRMECTTANGRAGCTSMQA